MHKQKSRVAQLLRQISLKCDASAQGLTSSSPRGYMHSTINARLEQTEADHQRLECEITRLSRYCKKRLSGVQYNIDVVKGREIILTNGYVKKQRKVDTRELERARTYKKDWEQRQL